MKRNLLAATALGCTLLLAGCGLSGATGSTDTHESGKITGSISFQTWNLKASYQKYFESLITDFEKEYPGTSVKWIDQPADGYADKLSAQASSGTLPDVINLDLGTGYPLAKAGLLVNISQADPTAKDAYLPAAWEGLHIKTLGGVFGYPWYLNTGPSFFNTALFAKAGLDPNKPPTTYDQLFEDATVMATATGGKYSMLGAAPAIEDFAMYGSQPMNADQTKFTFNDAKGVQLVQHYKDVYDKGGLIKEALSQSSTGQDDFFQSGQLAYTPGSAYSVTQIQQNAPSVYKSLKVSAPITNNKPTIYYQGLGVSAKSKNRATAMAFAKFVTNKQNQLAFAKQVAVFPSTVDTLSDPYFTTSDGTLQGEVRVESAAQIGRGQLIVLPGYTEAMKTELRNEVVLGIEGKKPIQKALDDAVAYCNQRLNG